jgi:excisionase family DNA binding protein
MSRTDPTNLETIAAAAARYGLSPRTIRRRIAEGALVGYRFGPRLIRVNVAEVDALLRPIVPRPAQAARPLRGQGGMRPLSARTGR